MAILPACTRRWTLNATSDDTSRVPNLRKICANLEKLRAPPDVACLLDFGFVSAIAKKKKKRNRVGTEQCNNSRINADFIKRLTLKWPTLVFTNHFAIIRGPSTERHVRNLCSFGM